MRVSLVRKLFKKKVEVPAVKIQAGRIFRCDKVLDTILDEISRLDE